MNNKSSVSKSFKIQFQSDIRRFSTLEVKNYSDLLALITRCYGHDTYIISIGDNVIINNDIDYQQVISNSNTLPNKKINKFYVFRANDSSKLPLCQTSTVVTDSDTISNDTWEYLSTKSNNSISVPVGKPPKDVKSLEPTLDKVNLSDSFDLLLESQKLSTIIIPNEGNETNNNTRSTPNNSVTGEKQAPIIISSDSSNTTNKVSSLQNTYASVLKSAEKKINTNSATNYSESKASKSFSSSISEPLFSTVVSGDGSPYTSATNSQTYQNAIKEVPNSYSATAPPDSVSILYNENKPDSAQSSVVLLDSSQESSFFVPKEVVCNLCNNSISGVRYKCSVCIDFYICPKCEEESDHGQNHPFYKITDPTKVPTNIMNGSKIINSNNSKKKLEIFLARYVSCNISPDSKFKPGEKFTCTWKIRNEGENKWPEHCSLIHVGGDNLGNFTAAIPSPSALPGQEIEISINLIAPNSPGRYTGFWRLQCSDGVRFGHRMDCRIFVPEDSVDEKVEEKKTDDNSKKNEVRIVFQLIHDNYPNYKYKNALLQLVEMGFTSIERNIKLLDKEKGNVEHALSKLLQQK